jgi:hypothetical protein
MSISINDLVSQLATIGVIETAINGAFHDLPGSGGSGGTSNVKMYQATATQMGPPGSANANFYYTQTPPFTVQPFLQAVILNPTIDYEYTTSVFGFDDLTGASVLVNYTWIGTGDDPNTGVPVNVGLRVEPFVATA